MRRYSKSKKGQTLPEVMVALLIVMITLTSTVTLMVTVSRLALNAKTQTEAIILAQSEMSEAKKRLSGNSCGITPTSLSTLNFPFTDSGGKSGTVNFASAINNPPTQDNVGSYIDASGVAFTQKFAKVTVTVIWGAGESYSIDELVRIDG